MRFFITTASFIVNDGEAFPQSFSKIDKGVFHRINHESTRIDTNATGLAVESCSVNSCPFVVSYRSGETPTFMSAWACLGEELPLGFEPIRIGVARQGESASSFRNKVGAHANFLVRQLRRLACFRRH